MKNITKFKIVFIDNKKDFYKIRIILYILGIKWNRNNRNMYYNNKFFPLRIVMSDYKFVPDSSIVSHNMNDGRNEYLVCIANDPLDKRKSVRLNKLIFN